MVQKWVEVFVVQFVEKLEFVGLFVVEMFVMEDGDFMINELVLCFYNLGYYMFDFCEMS